MSGGAGPSGWLADEGEDAPLLWQAQTAFPRSLTPATMGVAVSGGSDSLAMLHLFARAAIHAGWQVAAVTVDHRLRPEAADEAAVVGRVCAALGVPHQVLSWEHGALAGNVMDAARRARYGLIAGWARARGIARVAIGHTADDQAETFLIGLSRAAGLDGLSGMRPTWDQHGATFLRPFLSRTRADLRAYLRRHGLAWVDDPTNDDDRYTRIKARRVLHALKPLGITAERLSQSVEHLAGARQALVEAALEASRAMVREEAGALWIDSADFRGLGPELQRRILLAALRWLSGIGHPPRQTAMTNLEIALREGRDATAGGCRFRDRGAMLLVAREPRAVALLSTPTDTPWDDRWHLSGPHAPDLATRALGADGLRACRDWRAASLPREILVVTPSVWRGDTLVAAPLAGLAAGWTATVSPSFPATIKAH